MSLSPPPTHGTPQDGHTSLGGRIAIAANTGRAGTDMVFAAVQTSLMPMCVTDPHRPDNPIVFCNAAFETLTGYTRDEILGRNCRFLQGDATDARAVAEIRRALANGESVHIELLNYRKDSSSYWNALFISPVTDADGTLVYHFASQLDVTRTREAEAVLQQSQRMDTLGSMASSLAHEFNNLMTIVLANLERLDGETDPDRRARKVEHATWGARRAAKLTDQMLSFARRQFHDDRVVDVNRTLAAFDAILDQMAGPKARLRLELADGLLPASVDASQLEMALLNLVRNAADAASAGGEIIIATGVRKPDDLEDGPWVEIAVSDNGSGMTADVARRSMEPFFTTKAHGRGTGLGLSMVKSFVEQSSGMLELESTPGGGTTVRMIFPMVADPGPG